MGRRVRVQTEDAGYFVSNRCLQQRFLLTPSKAVNAVILGCLARAAVEYGVVIYGFVFMSNHFHMLLSAPRLNLSEFMGAFQGQLATEINRLRGREGYVWQGRFRYEHVVDGPAMVDKMAYMMSNPTEADLVAHPDRWPGVCSWDAHMGDGRVTGHRLLKKEFRRLRRQDPDLTWEEALEEADHTFELAPIPAWADLDPETYRTTLRELVDDRCEAYQRELKRRRRNFMGARKVVAQHWNRRPASTDRSPQPLCHCHDPKRREEHVEWYFEVCGRYRKAMGDYTSESARKRARAAFPHGTYPPGRRRAAGA